MSRRSFFETLGRRGALVVFGASGAFFARRGQLSAEAPGETCVNDGFCRKCGVANGCRLPLAVSFRQHQERKAGSETAEGGST